MCTSFIFIFTYIHNLYTYIIHVSCVFICIMSLLNPLETSYVSVLKEHPLHWRKKPTGITRSGWEVTFTVELSEKGHFRASKVQGGNKGFRNENPKSALFW